MSLVQYRVSSDIDKILLDWGIGIRCALAARPCFCFWGRYGCGPSRVPSDYSMPISTLSYLLIYGWCPEIWDESDNARQRLGETGLAVERQSTKSLLLPNYVLVSTNFGQSISNLEDRFQEYVYEMQIKMYNVRRLRQADKSISSRP